MKQEFFGCLHFAAQVWNYISITFQIDGLVQDCSNFIAIALELLQSCTKPLKC